MVFASTLVVLDLACPLSPSMRAGNDKGALYGVLASLADIPECASIDWGTQDGEPRRIIILIAWRPSVVDGVRPALPLKRILPFLRRLPKICPPTVYDMAYYYKPFAMSRDPKGIQCAMRLIPSYYGSSKPHVDVLEVRDKQTKLTRSTYLTDQMTYHGRAIQHSGGAAGEECQWLGDNEAASFRVEMCMNNPGFYPALLSRACHVVAAYRSWDRPGTCGANRGQGNLLGVVEMHVCLESYNISISQVPRCKLPLPESDCVGAGGNGENAQWERNCDKMVAAMEEVVMSVEEKTWTKVEDGDDWSIISADDYAG